MSRTIAGAVIQFPVTSDIAANVATLLELMQQCPLGALVVTPEGAVSGYAPETGFLARLDAAAVDAAIAEIGAAAGARDQCVVLGACVNRTGSWRNAAVVLAPDAPPREYWKVNLAHAERGMFQAGDALPVFDVRLRDITFRLGVQICREIRYPEQWRWLAERGADVIAFVNNAVGDTSIAPVWRSHLISRAAELQRFVLAANNAAPDQKCPSMIVSSEGKVLFEALSASAEIGNANLDLQKVSNWIIDQSRRDLDLSADG